MQTGSKLEKVVAAALKAQTPVRGLPGVRISDIVKTPKEPFDISFQLKSGDSRVLVFGEIKQAFSPRLLEEISPWIKRVKSMRDDVAYAVIAPALSPQSQSYCIENRIDFIDLAGNLFINIPGKFTLQRTGMRGEEATTASEASRMLNVFSGRSSRILRVLLEKPQPWSLTEIAKEISRETQRISSDRAGTQIDFTISLGAISKALASLEEQLWIRRRNGMVLVPEPRRLLMQWSEKYKERYRWRLRSSFQTPNPYSTDLASIASGLWQATSGLFVLTGVAAASLSAPFLDLDTVEIFLAGSQRQPQLRQLKAAQSRGPMLRFIEPYDVGVFMYSKLQEGIPVVSEIQTYLDLYARGGRDLKQADHLLSKAIEPRWAAA